MSDEPNKDASQTPDQPAPIDPYATSDKPLAPNGASTATFHPDEGAGSMVGKYKLLQQLGKGGMGVVWMAEQREPVQRYVAVKIIKGSMHGDQVLARFEAERQALAMMDHPNIAKVLDAGATDAGRPYFVMELVKGVPFSKYSDHEKLTLKERIELFIPVCNAVQHAHQKGIIHRDLKPSNVLIALYDGKPVPKVIDFGVAKATTQKLTEKTMFTEVGQIVGTLEYMAPEQAELNNLDIDTRADIYSLGVMLYEMLTGSPPFSAKQLRGEAFLEMLRLIREVEPQKPSTKLSSSQELPTVAANRKLEPGKIAGFMRGDLDWIVMKCLEKERARRYETANQLADELKRYLTDEPVQAGPPSVGYRTKKFLRRNKGPAIATAFVFLALILGIISTSLALVSAGQARDAEALQRQYAEANEAKAKKAADDAEKALAGERQANKKATAAAEAELRANAMARGRLEQIEKSNLLIDSMFRDFKPAFSPSGMMIGMGGMMGGAMMVGGVGGDAFSDPERLRQQWSNQLYKFAMNLDEKATNNPETVLRVRSTIGMALASMGETKKAIELVRKVHDQREALLGPNHADTLSSLYNLAYAYSLDPDQTDKAKKLYELVLDKRKAILGADHPDTLLSMKTQADGYLYSEDEKEREKAWSYFDFLLKIRRAKLGADHPDTLAYIGELADTYAALGYIDKALPLYELRLETEKSKFGPNYPEILERMRDLASTYQRVGELDGHHLHKAVGLWEIISEKSTAKFGPTNEEAQADMYSLAESYASAGRWDKALAFHEKKYEEAKTAFGPLDPRTAGLLDNLVFTYLRASQPEKATPLLNTLIAMRRKQFARGELGFALTLDRLAGELLRGGQPVAAEPILRELLDIRLKVHPEDVHTFHAKLQLGASLLGQKKYSEAEALFLKAYEEMSQRDQPFHHPYEPYMTNNLGLLAKLYDAQSKKPEAAFWRKELAVRQLWQALRGGRVNNLIETKPLDGSLTPSKSREVHDVQMQAGKIYVLTLESKEFDAHLTLEGADGNQISKNLDALLNRRSWRIIYSPRKSGPHRVIASSSTAGEAGKYTLRILESKGR